MSDPEILNWNEIVLTPDYDIPDIIREVNNALKVHRMEFVMNHELSNWGSEEYGDEYHYDLEEHDENDNQSIFIFKVEKLEIKQS